MLQIPVSELITRIRERTRRENSPFIADAEYLRLVDVAYRRLYNRIVKKVPWYFAVDMTINVVPGTLRYDLPANFRSLQYCAVLEPSWGSNRQIRPLQEAELAALQAPQDACTVTLKYTPEPVRVTDPAQLLPVIATSDEWIVNCASKDAITKEGTERAPYDQDFAILDGEVESYLYDYDQSMPQTINETFPFVAPYPYPRTLRIEGYILRGTPSVHQIELWGFRFPAIYNA